MAATDTSVIFGRVALLANEPNLLRVCINANGATYATASGGLPIDLTLALTQGAENDQAYINPADVVGIVIEGPSTNGFIPGQFLLGTPTYTQNVGSGYASAAGLPPAASSQGFETDQTLATCPATIRLYGTGSANHAALGEVADGANTDVFYFYLAIGTGGVNK